MKLKDYLVFFRWKNLLLILLIQILIKYVFFLKFDIATTLTTAEFVLLAVSILCISIAGYIINDIEDVTADKINKPNKVFIGNKITLKRANDLYIAFNSVGFIAGMYLSFLIDKISYFAIFLIASLLLYSYANRLKKKLIIGNLAIAFLSFLCILLVPIYDIVTATNSYNKEQQIAVFQVVLIFSIFSFLLTLIREIIKDIEDMEGDRKIGAKTISLVWGVRSAKQIVIFLSVIFIGSLLYFAYLLRLAHLTASIYFIVSCVIPLIYTVVLVSKSKTKKEFHKISNLLKMIMLLGILAFIIY